MPLTQAEEKSVNQKKETKSTFDTCLRLQREAANGKLIGNKGSAQEQKLTNLFSYMRSNPEMQQHSAAECVGIILERHDCNSPASLHKFH